MQIRSVVQFLGFMAGFLLLCMRSACVCWFGGKVSEETEELLKSITSLPSVFHNIEVTTLKKDRKHLIDFKHSRLKDLLMRLNIQMWL